MPPFLQEFQEAIKMSALGKRKFAFISALLLTCVTATAAAFCQMNEVNQTSFGVVVVGTQVAHTHKGSKTGIVLFFQFFPEWFGSDQTNLFLCSGRIHVTPKFNSDGNATGISRINWLFDQTKTSAKEFRYHLRMTKSVFEILENNLDEHLRPSQNSFRKDTLTVREIIAISLHYLGHKGEGQQTSEFFAKGTSTVFACIDAFCNAVCLQFSHEIALPDASESRTLAAHILRKRGLPGCLGALDGKHFPFACSRDELLSTYRCCKGHGSVNVLALVDCFYKFRWNSRFYGGKAGDAKMWNESELKKSLNLGLWPSSNNNQFIFAIPDHNGNDMEFSPDIIADSAFAASVHLMKSYSSQMMNSNDRLYNQILTKGRQMVEQGWGMLLNRFRCWKTTCEWKGPTAPRRLTTAIQACMLLHNICIDQSDCMEEVEILAPLLQKPEYEDLPCPALRLANAARDNIATFISRGWLLGNDNIARRK